MSIKDFCLHQGVAYNEFNKWFRKTHRSVVPVQIDGCPVTEVENQPAEVNQSPQTTVQNIKRKSNGILVSIQTRDGLHICRGNLDYPGLVELVKKLEGLCYDKYNNREDLQIAWYICKRLYQSFSQRGLIRKNRLAEPNTCQTEPTILIIIKICPTKWLNLSK